MTAPGRPLAAACAAPLDADVLMDYWLAALSPADEDRVEQHLMACDPCGDRLRETIVLADTLRALARSGSLRVVVNDEYARRAAAAGRRIREYRAAPGEHIQCTVSADDDLLLSRLTVDLQGAARVDVALCDERGTERHRLVDVPVRDDGGSVLFQESIDAAKAMPTSTLVMRLLAVEQEGSERVLGEYTFHHTRTIQDSARR
ncbi:MAG: zf-HC2 domain-containing protein [Vicinamibacterales bacterium]